MFCSKNILTLLKIFVIRVNLLLQLPYIESEQSVLELIHLKQSPRHYGKVAYIETNAILYDEEDKEAPNEKNDEKSKGTSYYYINKAGK